MYFQYKDKTITLATMPTQIPFCDIHGTAQHSNNWTTAEKDLENQNSHIIVTLLSSTKSKAEQFKILIKVLSSISLQQIV